MELELAGKIVLVTGAIIPMDGGTAATVV